MIWYVRGQLLRAEEAVREEQRYYPFPVTAEIDEYSVLFADAFDQERFAEDSAKLGFQVFNSTSDYMERLDKKKEAFNVHFDFLSVPSKPWRIEAMCVTGGTAPLHTAAMGDNMGYAGVFHASYKLPSLDIYLTHIGILKVTGYEMAAEYQNSYGRFSYWRLAPHLPYFKPRCNLRD